MGNNIDYNRIYQLKNKIDSGTASIQEKNEYMAFLYNNGSITKEQYDKYNSDNNSNEVWSAVKAVGGIILAGYLLKKLFSQEK
ncbi:hypothetical protein [Pseudofulvibacter geojedonensis]|uniref:Glutaminyl-tRNA synthetase n=1 Tax=Pseudofulvibacter geojedonensis TaxID=1123758 RepID=A0ABW3I3M2_9FLAO